MVVFKIGCSFLRIFSYQDEVFDVNVTCLDKAIYTNENKIMQACCNLSFADLLQLMEKTCSKPVDNKF